MAGKPCYSCSYPYIPSGGGYCPSCGAHNDGCFISTAIFQSLKKPDNCEELELLREYRDNYLITNPERKIEVENYYKYAPEIVKIISYRDDSEQIYSTIFNDFLSIALTLIKEEKNEDAYFIYRDMIHYVCEKIEFKDY
jgi:hypothetical protein